jgi:thiamine biosynthesis lipoprotein
VRWLVGLILAVVGLASLTEFTLQLQRYEAVEPHMGTLVRITLYAPDERVARDAFRAAFDRIAALDRTLSDYQADSELSRLPSTAINQPVTVSEDLFAVLSASQTLAEATGGAFDVTQGPVVRLWREARRTQRLPDEAALAEARARSGFDKLRLDPAARTVTLAAASMALDVGAIGKGYAASEAIEVLTGRGVPSALVAISGDLAFSAAPPGRRGWRVGVHTLDASVTDVPATLDLTNAAVSTSGSSEQYVDIGGRRYSHVIDPRTGEGLTHDVTVTVIAPDGLVADGLDTAISIIGLERGFALLDRYPRAGALVVERRAGETRVTASPRFPVLARQHRVRPLARD